MVVCVLFYVVISINSMLLHLSFVLASLLGSQYQVRLTNGTLGLFLFICFQGDAFKMKELLNSSLSSLEISQYMLACLLMITWPITNYIFFLSNICYGCNRMEMFITSCQSVCCDLKLWVNLGSLHLSPVERSKALTSAW